MHHLNQFHSQVMIKRNLAGPPLYMLVCVSLGKCACIMHSYVNGLHMEYRHVVIHCSKVKQLRPVI